MISITGNLLSTEDKRFIRYATVYTMDYLLPDMPRSDYLLKIDVSAGSRTDCFAECGFKISRKLNICNIWVHSQFVQDHLKTVFNRFDKTFFLYLCHELTHAKQYIKGELKDLNGGKYKFKGVFYKETDDDDLEGYYLSPHEMEARAYEEWLWIRLREHLKKARGISSARK